LQKVIRAGVKYFYLGPFDVTFDQVHLTQPGNLQELFEADRVDFNGPILITEGSRQDGGGLRVGGKVQGQPAGRGRDRKVIHRQLRMRLNRLATAWVSLNRVAPTTELA